MARLVLVRHGQASSLVRGDYDQLSPLGVRQARLLGEHWAARGVRFDHVFVGPRRRHAQTHAEVAAAYRDAGVPLPEPVQLPHLDEHHGMAVVAHHMPELTRCDPEVAEVVEALARGDAGRMRDFLRVFRRVLRAWADGRLRSPDGGPEDWGPFRSRVREGVRAMAAHAGAAQRVVAFTSGGTTAAVVCDALGIDDGRAMDLSFEVRNASVTELRLAADGAVALHTFNVLGHLEHDDGLVTFL
jgi:broad specificity phosphatase PhoE